MGAVDKSGGGGAIRKTVMSASGQIEKSRRVYPVSAVQLEADNKIIHR